MNRSRTTAVQVVLFALTGWFVTAAAQAPADRAPILRSLSAAAPAPSAAWRDSSRGYPRREIYGGLAYANISVAGLAKREHAVGWGASASVNVSRYFGFAADFAGVYDPGCDPNTQLDCLLELLVATEKIDYNSHQLLGGPRFTIRGRRFNRFVHALGGGARTHVSHIALTTGARTVTNSGFRPAMAFGGGMDWNASDGLAVRIFQADYMGVRARNIWRHNARIQGGVVFRF